MQDVDLVHTSAQKGKEIDFGKIRQNLFVGNRRGTPIGASRNHPGVLSKVLYSVQLWVTGGLTFCQL